MFWVRLRSSIILIVLALVTMFAGGYVLLAAMVFLSLVAYREITGATGVRAQEKPGKKNGLEIVGIVGIIFYYILLSLSTENGMIPVETAVLFALIGVFMGGMFVYVFGFPKFQASQVMAAFFGFFYGPVCLSFIYMTRQFCGRVYGS